MDYKKLLQTSEYDFLRTNPYLGNHILLLTLGGSRAYGTNLPTSDVDIRGIAATPMSALFGLEKWNMDYWATEKTMIKNYRC